MIVFGTNTKLLSQERIFDKCRNCESTSTIDIYVYQKYFTLFWVPFVPTSKEGVSECTNCKQRFNDARYMPGYLLEAFLAARKRASTPAWTFLGLGIIPIGIAAIIYFEYEDNKEDAQFVLAPKAGDEYEVKTDDNMYTLYKVDEVEGDSLTLLINDWQTEESSGLPSIRRRKNGGYSDTRFVVPKETIKEMYDNDQIVEVDR